MGRCGLVLPQLDENSPIPSSAEVLKDTYEKLAHALYKAVMTNWADETLLVEDEMYGERWKRGQTLLALVSHQAHHRNQISVLVRQAGLKPTSIYGPTREQWAEYGMEAPKV